MRATLEADVLLSIAVTVTSEQRVESVLQNTVQGLAAQPGVALARIWLLPSIHLPSSLRELPDAPEGGGYLHLVASAGTPINSPGEDWSSLQGHFARFPLHVGKVGQVGAERHPILIKDIAHELSLSPATVATYRARVLEKMNMKSNVELTSYALRHHLID